MKHILSILVRNHAGVLSHVAGLFARRGYNIESITAGITEDPEISRLTIVVKGDEHTLEQVSNQLGKLIDVITIIDLKPTNAIARELAIITINVDGSKRNDAIQIAQAFKAKIADISENTLTIELTDTEHNINNLIKLLSPYKIVELGRTGTLALPLRSVLHWQSE
ncbi:MAG: acetolactate synthase small subunit [bacterium]